MKRDFSRRRFIASLGALAASTTTGYAAPPASSLRPVLRGEEFYKRAVRSVEEIVAAEKLSGRVAFAVAHADSGLWLECENEEQGTPPASVTKAITALYALDVLGPAHRFDTQILATGGIVEGVVQGDLILAGGGDPTLDTNALAEMAAALKAAGVREVRGQFKVYEASLPVLREIDPAQPDQVGYNPAVSGLALNFNRVHFEWKRGGNGYTVKMDARSDKYRPDVAMARMTLSERRAPVYEFEEKADVDQWSVSRGALGNGGSRWLPVRKPGLYAGDVFATMAGAQGIRLGRPHMIDTMPDGDVVTTHQSAPLLEILQGMLRFSTNLTAEMVGLAATQARVGRVGTLAASAAEMNSWAISALGMQAPALVDHSGLGDASRVTALDMATALVKVRNSALKPILKPFVMRNPKGQPQKDHPISVAAKTGTLNFVSSLAGYLTAQDGTEMAFAIFAANTDLRAGIAREDREAPRGARTWNRRAKRVQQALIERWGVMYGT